MKIQITQTLANGQVTQQVLSKDSAEVLKIQAQPGAKVSFNVEGAKPADAMNAQAKTGNIKKVGNNLVLESDGEQLVEVTDFYSTAGASVGDVGWNYAATDAGVMSATPEAQALASDAAASESGALLPVIAPGWLLFGGAAAVAVATSGGSSAAAVSSTVVSGLVTAGPVKPGHQLSVTLYKADGTNLGETTELDSTGRFSVNVGTYSGAVKAVVTDSSTDPDYTDETTNAGKDLSAILMSVGVISSGVALTLNINALTTVAAQQALGAADGTGLLTSTTAVTNANSAVAAALGLTDLTGTTPVTTLDSGFVATSAAGKFGVLLAALSGLDATAASSQIAIDALTAGITFTGAAGVLSPGQQTALMTGATTADANGLLGLVSALSDLMSASVTTVGFSIGEIASDNLVTLSDSFAAGSTMTGIASAGTLLADLGIKFAGTVGTGGTWALTGTAWTYTLSAADVAALTTGDGAKSVDLTVSGITKSARVVMVNLVDDAPTAVSLISPITTLAENTATTTRIKVADIAVADIDAGSTLNVTGADAAFFEADSTGLYIKAGVSLNYEGLNNSYSVTVTATGGTTPVTVSSTNYTLTLTNVNEAPTAVGTIAAQTAVVGIDYSFNTSASFTDIDAGGLTGGVYSATGLGNGLSIDASTGIISGIALADAQAAPVVVTFTDAGGLAVSHAAFNLQAVTAPVVQSFAVTDATTPSTKGMAGEALTFIVTMSEAVTSSAGLTAHFSVNGVDVTATSAAVTGSITITFTSGVVPATGDGTTISLTSLAATSGSILGDLSHQAMVVPTPGAISTSAYEVDNTAPTFAAVTLSAAENVTTITGSLGATDANGVTYSLGTGLDTALFSLSGSTLSLLAVKDYEVDETTDHAYTLNVIATDAVGHATTSVVTVNLTNVNEAPTVAIPLVDQTAVLTQAFSYTVPVGAFVDVDAGTTLSYSATLVSGAALSTATGWTNLAFDAATRTFSGTATNENTGDVVVRVTASDGTLSVYDDVAINAVSAPTFTSSIDNNTKFDVRSDLVLTASEGVTAVAGKYIHIINDANAGAFLGYLSEATVHTQDILVTDASQLTISGNKITLNPGWDLDLGNNYHIEIDAGAFIGVTSGMESVAIADSTSMNFSTVSPFIANLASLMTSAAASEKMVAGTDAIAASGSWFSVMSNTAGVGDTSTANAGAIFDLTGGDYVILGGRDDSIVPQDLNLSESGLSLPFTMWVQLDGFGLQDSIYIDDQHNNAAYPNDVEGDPSAVQPLTEDRSGVPYVFTRIAVPASNGQGWFDISVASDVATPNFYSIAEMMAATNSQAVLVG